MDTKHLTTLVVVLLAGAALSGCMGKKDDTGGDAMGQGTATAVTIDAPKAPVDGASEVCWHVAGSGNVAHVAIHWDTASHASESDRTFQDYDAGAAYPDNTAALDTEGYDLPGDFCADVEAPTAGNLYVVGHVIDKGGAPGKLSAEVQVGPAGTPVDLKGKGVATAVEIVTATDDGLVCWTVRGTGNVPHVAIHWDNVSHAGESGATFAAYDAGAAYPDNHTEGGKPAADPDGYDLTAAGARFCAKATVPAGAGIYVVGHVIDVSGAPGRMSAEREIGTGDDGDDEPATADLKIQNTLLGYTPDPLEVDPGTNVTVTNDDPAVAHTVTSDDGTSFDTGNIAAGGATASFDAPQAAGDYAYHCKIHPNMKGTLHVGA